jgi:hypothetical protein
MLSFLEYVCFTFLVGFKIILKNDFEDGLSKTSSRA